MDSSILFPPAFEPRHYQLRIVAQAIESFTGAKGLESILVESPTGSGKTVIGLATAMWFARERGYSIGWAAMRRNLLAQAAAENARGFGLDLKLISMFDKHPPQVDLLIIDEAQHDAALSMANLHSIIKPKKILGLSATPFRSDRFKLCFQKSIRDAGIHHLIQDGYLSPYHHYTIPNYTPGSVAETYANEPDRWGKSLIFFHKHSDCIACREELKQRGIEAEVVTAKTDRERQIEDFASGRLRVLINMLILSEGFDCPSLQTVFCRPSGKLCSVQMGGRVFRRCEGVAFKQIVQCEQTRHPFPRTAAPAEQYLWTSGGWRSLSVNRRIDAIAHRMQAIVAGTVTKLPAFLSEPPLVFGRPTRSRTRRRFHRQPFSRSAWED